MPIEMDGKDALRPGPDRRRNSVRIDRRGLLVAIDKHGRRAEPQDGHYGSEKGVRRHDHLVAFRDAHGFEDEVYRRCPGADANAVPDPAVRGKVLLETRELLAKDVF